MLNNKATWQQFNNKMRRWQKQDGKTRQDKRTPADQNIWNGHNTHKTTTRQTGKNPWNCQRWIHLNFPDCQLFLQLFLLQKWQNQPLKQMSNQSWPGFWEIPLHPFGVKRLMTKILSGSEWTALAGMGHSPPDLGPGQLIHFRSQPGKFELKSAICQIDTKYIFIPKCLAPCHPKLLKTIYKSFLDTHLKKGYWNASNVV